MWPAWCSGATWRCMWFWRASWYLSSTLLSVWPVVDWRGRPVYTNSRWATTTMIGEWCLDDCTFIDTVIITNLVFNYIHMRLGRSFVFWWFLMIYVSSWVIAVSLRRWVHKLLHNEICHVNCHAKWSQYANDNKVFYLHSQPTMFEL